jgi:hypothetical protein
MSRISRIVVLVTAVASLAGVMSSAASAVTWHNSGASAFTATAGAFSYSATGVNLACSSATATGTVGATPFVGATWAAASGQIHYNGCFFAGTSWTINCGYTLTAQTQPSAGVTTGNLDVTCDITQFGAKLCHIENHNPGLHAQYTNPSGGVGGRLTVTTGIVRLTNPPTGSCPLGNGDTLHLTHQTFGITSPAGGGPIITRTA